MSKSYKRMGTVAAACLTLAAGVVWAQTATSINTETGTTVQGRAPEQPMNRQTMPQTTSQTTPQTSNMQGSTGAMPSSNSTTGSGSSYSGSTGNSAGSNTSGSGMSSDANTSGSGMTNSDGTMRAARRDRN
jgi:hypothetical protein